MDLEAIIRIHPEIVIVDELAHTNVEGSLNEKRWQDVMTLLDEGINVISAVNIQHIESVNEEVQDIAGIEVKERIPDSVLQEADEVVNIDLTAISSQEKTPRRIIRKVARLATRYNTSFVALYVQVPKESMERIDLASQRHLLNHFKLVTELGGEVVQVQSKDILGSIVQVCKEKQISTVCMGSPGLRLPGALCSVLKYRRFLNNLAQANIDLIILA